MVRPVLLASGVHADILLLPAADEPTASLVVRKVARASVAPHSIVAEAAALAACASDHVVALLGSSPTTLDLPLLAPLALLTHAVPSYALWTHIARSLFSGLAAVHSAGWAHLDVKPGNVMLSWTGDVRLIDFGISARLGDARTSTVGSGPYRAPELLFSPTIGEAKALDMWAAALVLAEFFRPFQTSPDPVAGSSSGSDSDSNSNSDDDSDAGSGSGSDSTARLDAGDSDDEPARAGPSRRPRLAYSLERLAKRTRRPARRRPAIAGDWDDEASGVQPRRPLFDAAFGDLGLAGSIFRQLGTPTVDNWPTFTDLPDADKIHFHPRHPRPLSAALPGLARLDLPERHAVLRVLGGLLVLEPSRRTSAPDARDAVEVAGGWEDEMQEYLDEAEAEVGRKLAGSRARDE
ncbi:hypothetical protein Q5752_000182 [Cryptotrichosporon argae]